MISHNSNSDSNSPCGSSSRMRVVLSCSWLLHRSVVRLVCPAAPGVAGGMGAWVCGAAGTRRGTWRLQASCSTLQWG
jgi:hypothetical protein